MKFSYANNATPINQDETFNLIPSGIITQDDLNVFEQKNIKDAEDWLFRGKNKKLKISDDFIRKIHKKMFDKTWKWAGKYRTQDMNIGTDWQRIPQDMIYLCDDLNYQLDNKIYEIDEIAVRFSHRLVLIHPFQNGNGRLSRLVADWIVWANGKPRLTWGNVSLTEQSEIRKKYINALKKADEHDISDLLEFARS